MTTPKAVLLLLAVLTQVGTAESAGSWDALRTSISRIRLASSTQMSARAEERRRVSPNTEYLEQARQMACFMGIHPALAAALIEAESSWNFGAVGVNAEEGPGQVMPSTAIQYQLDRSRLREPLYGLYASFFILRTLLNLLQDESEALRAYNAGAGFRRVRLGPAALQQVERYVDNIKGRRLKYVHLFC